METQKKHGHAIASNDKKMDTSSTNQPIATFVPNHLTLAETVRLPAFPHALYSYEGSTYVGMNNCCIARVNNSQLAESFIKCTNPVQSVAMYKDRVYALLASRSIKNDDQVCVYDMLGQLQATWNHPVSSFNCNALTIVSDQLILPDLFHQKLTVYSLLGKVIKNIPCSAIGNSRLAMCAAGSDSVIISDSSSNTVFKMSINSGEIIWKCEEIIEPQCITCDERGQVLVVSEEKLLRVLDAGKGNVIRKVTGLVDGFKAGLYVYENQLLAISHERKELLTYQWNN
ncbi:uncharacterized protein [Watersipora subatra]|uniref:uncharacterized protein n=1 Tax=Watersipora subatra TaxID=2589382 RepID=UPI00355BC301